MAPQVGVRLLLFLKKKGAEPDVRHVSWAGSKAVYYKVLWPTAPVDSEDGGTAAVQAGLDKWLWTFLQSQCLIHIL